MILGANLGVEVAEAVSIGKWLVAFGLIFGIYLKMRSWEKTLRPDADEVKVKQPVITQRAEVFVTAQKHREDLEAESRRASQEVEAERRRIGALETRVQAMETKMDSDKEEILTAMTEVRGDIAAAVAKISGLDERTIATNAALTVQDQKLNAILAKL